MQKSWGSAGNAYLYGNFTDDCDNMKVCFTYGNFLAAYAIWLVMSFGSYAQEYPYAVKDTRIPREEFMEAYQHRDDYNHVRDTTLACDVKKKVEVAVFRTLTDEEKEAYVWEDYSICRIGRYPTGEYAADLWYGNWMGAVFLDRSFQIDTTVINASDRGVYSKSGIYAGCGGFDCDDCACIHFYSHKEGQLGRMEEIAVYFDSGWSLPFDYDYPEFSGIENHDALVWYKGALYCAGQERYGSDGRWTGKPVFVKLEIRKVEDIYIRICTDFRSGSDLPQD